MFNGGVAYENPEAIDGAPDVVPDVDSLPGRPGVD